MHKKRLKKKVKIIVVGITTLIIYVLMAFLGAFKDISVVSSIFILFGWFWLLAGQIMALYVIWRK